MTKRPLVMFSPMPPLKNGIADYTASFVDSLACQYDLYVVTPENTAPLHTPGYTSLTALEYDQHTSSFATAAHAYQIGNNLDHVYALKPLSNVPGLVTIHDLSIQHMVGASFPGGAGGEAYAELMFEAYGRQGLEISRDVSRWQRQSHVVHSELGLLPLLVRRAKGIVTHSFTGFLRATAAGYERPIHVIPHHYQERIDALRGSRQDRRRAARHSLGLRQDAIILLSLGFVTRAKRVDLTLKALKLIPEREKPVILVVAGEQNAEEIDLAAEIQRLGLHGRVLIQGYVPDGQMIDYLAACDILVNLRYPTLGESSGSLANGLGVGCCTVVTDIGTFSELPDECVVKVGVQEMTPDGLAYRLLPLVSNDCYRETLESNARHYAESNLRTEQFVTRYIDAIEDCLFDIVTVQVPSYRQVRRFLAPSVRKDVEAKATALSRQCPLRPASMWWRELLLPVGRKSDVLMTSDGFAAQLAKDAFGWSDVISAADSGAGRTAGTILATCEAEDFVDQPGEFLYRTVSRLQLGGILIFNIIDRHGKYFAHISELFDGDDEAPPLNLAVKRSRISTLCEEVGLIIQRQISAFQEISINGAISDAGTEFAFVATLRSLVTWDGSAIRINE
ncbi:glycosyltransferase [Sphingomonas sp. AP4-R1]|uniref:glycosyltransferase family 4 protein n=1 Tax=Sphingomonas sp. AP4-R1 TaxID=2735134 RepID=UPI0014939B88|nr:glycosyltransferase [Sphingomonas sp. AP4-R1]QJU57619.1 glycosyltransferase [Sphingomonas sp. AP4-R1]